MGRGRGLARLVPPLEYFDLVFNSYAFVAFFSVACESRAAAFDIFDCFVVIFWPPWFSARKTFWTQLKLFSG